MKVGIEILDIDDNELFDKIMSEEEKTTILNALIEGRLIFAKKNLLEDECVAFIQHIILCRWVHYCTELALQNLVALDWDGEGIGVYKK